MKPLKKIICAAELALLAIFWLIVILPIIIAINIAARIPKKPPKLKTL